MKNVDNEIMVKVQQNDGSYQDVEILVRRPNNATISAADRYRAKVWNQCIKDGIMTRKQVDKFLKENDVWGTSQEEEQQKIIQQINALEKDLYTGKNGEKKRKLSEGRDIAHNIKNLRNQLRNLIAEKMSLQDNTAEALADNARFDYLVSGCTFYKKNGEKVYSSIEDYNSKSSDEVAFAAAAKLGEMLYALDSNFEKNLPENKWLLDFKLVDDNLNPIKNDVLVDGDGRRINELGQYVDEDGNRIDRDGAPLEQDGTYKMQVEYEDDINTTEQQPKTKKTKTTKKTTESPETA
jgi:hypothetical protein